MKTMLLSLICFVLVGSTAFALQNEGNSNGLWRGLQFKPDVQTTGSDFVFYSQESDKFAGRLNTVFGLRQALLAAPDGQYAANTPEELQTYIDLNMTYQYIESAAIRKHLKLANEEGLIIESVSESGLGQNVGFQAGDLVLRVDEKPVDTQYKFVIGLTENRGNATTTLIRRDGESHQLQFVLEPVKLQETKRWIVGVSVDEMSDILKAHLGPSGVVITSVSEDTPSQKMGLAVNDIIVKIGDSEISTADELRNAVQATKGAAVTLELIRSGNRMTIELVPIQVDNGSEGLPDLDLKVSDFKVAAREFGRLDLLHSYYVPGIHLPNWDQQPTATKLDELTKQVEALRLQIESLTQAINKKD